MPSNLETPYPRPLSGAKVANPPSGLIPSRSVLQGSHVRLEPIDPARHSDDLYACSQGSRAADNIWTYLPYGPWMSQDALTTWLCSCAASHDPMFFAICPTDTDKASGMASYLNIVPGNGTIEIGHIWFAPHMQRTRAATETLFLLLDYAMGTLNYRRMEWKCNALNQRSRDAAHRLGFRFEGVFYNHIIVKGHNRDTVWFSILDDEWPEVRAIISNWLADKNFDDDGAARTSLSDAMRARGPSSRG